jgi:cell wall-associated NlpC family hydrolase
MLRHKTLRLSVLVFLVLACAAAVPQLAGQSPAPAEIVAAVKARFAPDARVAVFDVTASAKGSSIELTGDVDRADEKDAIVAALHEAGFSSVVDKVAVLPGPEFTARPLGIVTVSVAVMKTKPSHASELANQLLAGTAVRLLKKEGGWYYVQSLDDRYLGWMEPDHLALVTSEQAGAFSRAPRVIVTALFTLVRERPLADAPSVADLVVGDVLEATGDAGAWAAVRLPDGRAGFVSRADAADYGAWKSSRTASPENIEQTARRFMGVPYLWGGTSVKGFDCSGFVKTVFRLNGRDLPRDADQQSEQGVAVPVDDGLAQARKGDALFFGPRPGVTRITHTGIYLGGKLFIHCSGMVKLNSFDPASPLYSDALLRRLVKVRRM